MSMNILKKIYFLISLSGEVRIIIYFIFLLIGAIFELLSIGLIFPFITLALGSELPDNLIFINKFLSFISYNLSISYLTAAIIFLLSIFIIKNIFLIYYNWWRFDFSNVVQLNLSQRLFSFYLSRPLIFHLQKNSSILIRNLISEISQVQKILISVLTFFFEFVVFISILSMLIIAEPMAALLSITILGTSSLIYFLLTKKKISQWGKIRLKQSSKYLKNITQSINSIKEIIVTGRIKLFLDIHYNQRKTLASIMQKFGIIDIIPKYLFEILAILAFSAIILFFSKQEKSHAEVLPLIGLFVMAAYRLMPSVTRILSAFQGIVYKLPTIDNLYDELRCQKKEVKDFDSFFKFQENITSRYFFRDKIEIKNLIYYFASSKIKILDHVSFTINKGDMVGIVGDSGSGKSTLINLLMGLLTTDEEFIFIDDQPIKKILNIWRNDIGYVAQSPYIVDDTIRNNIGFGIPENMIDDNKIDRCIEFSQLKKFILSKSKGINTRVGETGSNISGGQLQRIALARALYHDPSILIFDEPTSALDSNIETQIIKDLKKMKGNKTIILVSHKKSTLQYCDQIIEIKKGKVANIKYNKLR